jgi:hypothetical protein
MRESRAATTSLYGMPHSPHSNPHDESRRTLPWQNGQVFVGLMALWRIQSDQNAASPCKAHWGHDSEPYAIVRGTEQSGHWMLMFNSYGLETAPASAGAVDAR